MTYIKYLLTIMEAWRERNDKPAQAIALPVQRLKTMKYLVIDEAYCISPLYVRIMQLLVPNATIVLCGDQHQIDFRDYERSSIKWHVKHDGYLTKSKRMPNNIAQLFSNYIPGITGTEEI